LTNAPRYAPTEGTGGGLSCGVVVGVTVVGVEVVGVTAVVVVEDADRWGGLVLHEVSNAVTARVIPTVAARNLRPL